MMFDYQKDKIGNYDLKTDNNPFFLTQPKQSSEDIIYQRKPIDKYQKYKSLINHPDIWKMVMNGKDHDFGKFGYDFHRLIYHDIEKNRDIHLPLSEEISVEISKIIATQDSNQNKLKNISELLKKEVEVNNNNLLFYYLTKKKPNFNFIPGEYGYMENMLKALSYMFENLGKKINPDEYVKLHDLAVNNVENMACNAEGFRTDVGGFGLDNGEDGNFSEQGFREWQQKKLSTWESDKLTIMSDSPMFPGIKQRRYLKKGEKSSKCIQNIKDLDFNDLVFQANNFKDPKLSCQVVFDEYYEMMETLNKEGKFPGCKTSEKSHLFEKKLEIIARICQNLDQMHLFGDGNIRTIGFLLLNKFLIENDLSPTIMWDPNMLDFRSIQEIINHIKDGQQYFQDTFFY